VRSTRSNEMLEQLTQLRAAESTCRANHMMIRPALQAACKLARPACLFVSGESEKGATQAYTGRRSCNWHSPSL
jgi:hypothetical protein